MALCSNIGVSAIVSYPRFYIHCAKEDFIYLINAHIESVPCSGHP